MTKTWTHDRDNRHEPGGGGGNRPNISRQLALGRAIVCHAVCMRNFAFITRQTIITIQGAINETVGFRVLKSKGKIIKKKNAVECVQLQNGYVTCRSFFKKIFHTRCVKKKKFSNEGLAFTRARLQNGVDDTER